MPHETRHAGYLISDDPARVDLDIVHAYLSRDSYWAKNVPREIVAVSLQNSLCIGAYAGDGAQVGLSRVITDFATYAWLCDVFVLPAHRRHGLGKALVEMVMGHPRLQTLRRFALATQDAHGLYAKFGFTPLPAPERHLEKRNFASYPAHP